MANIVHKVHAGFNVTRVLLGGVDMCDPKTHAITQEYAQTWPCYAWGRKRLGMQEGLQSKGLCYRVLEGQCCKRAMIQYPASQADPCLQFKVPFPEKGSWGRMAEEQGGSRGVVIPMARCYMGRLEAWGYFSFSVSYKLGWSSAAADHTSCVYP